MPERMNSVKTSFFGKGAIRLLIPELKKMGIRRALVVTDRFLYESGAAARVGEVLSEAGVEYAVYYQVTPNPTVSIVEECIHAAKGLSVDLLVALGGGSAIDTAKAVSIVVANGGSVESYEGIDQSSRPGIPIVAVNTTAGTGSECTSFYIVTDPVRHSKMTMVDTNCMVSIAVNDTDFMRSMPPKLTAATGMDAMTHGVEAVLSKNATPLTDKDALWAIETIAKYLPRAVADGSDEEARERMAYAEYTAGMAFSNAGLGMVHAMAHALGGRYNLPHGVCNAVLLPYVLIYNGSSEIAKKGFKKIACALGLESKDVASVVAALSSLSAGVGIAQTLKELKGVNPVDFPALADLALHDSCMATNPVQPEKKDVIMVYQMAYNGLENRV
ncbi:MAG: iron-containing alcohol dehydrogenase [Clostridiaceae bacterium]|nr:iron-containing alcohol dehydrogenase [Clostridiaceae bacterium]